LHYQKNILIFFSDEKKQYDPSGFRDEILKGLDKAGDDLEAVTKFLDVSGSKLDYRRYGVNLIEILIAGGLLGNLKKPFPDFLTLIFKN
jgi:methylase of polypeptide subunit release factors